MSWNLFKKKEKKRETHLPELEAKDGAKFAEHLFGKILAKKHADETF